MRRMALGKHGWSILSGLLLCISAAGYAHAAPTSAVTVAIGSPTPNSMVGGRITVSIAYNAGPSKISAFTLYVDDTIYRSQPYVGMKERGIEYLDLDTRALPDGNHTLKVVVMGERALAADAVTITVRNGVAGGLDIAPPLVQFRGLRDGDTVEAGRITLDLLVQDNVAVDLLSVLANKRPVFLSNRPPFTFELDTEPYVDKATGTGTIRLEALAWDRAQNLGKARPMTLNVITRPNLTPMKADPTSRPGTAKPELPSGASTVRQDENPALVVPLTAPAAAPAVEPATRMALNSMEPVAPELSSTAGESRASLAQGRDRLPAGSRPSVRPSSEPATPTAPAAPESIRSSAASAALASVRNAAPGVRAARPVRMAKASVPVLPRVRPSAPGTATVTVEKTAPTVTIDIPVAEPVRQDAPAAAVPVVAPPAPAPAVRAPRVARPVSLNRVARAMPMAKVTRALKSAASKPLVVVVDRKRASADGRVPVVGVFRVRSPKATAPQDRQYRLKQGDTLGQVARKFQVTPKSIMVANGIRDPRGLRRGSVIRVPGTFDVVLNNERIAFDVSPRVENGLPLAPFRQLFEHTGGVVAWYPEDRMVRAANAETEVKLQIGSKEATVNQVVVVMDREAFLEGGRTIVPISFMEKALNLKAEFDPKSGAITLAPK